MCCVPCASEVGSEPAESAAATSSSSSKALPKSLAVLEDTAGFSQSLETSEDVTSSLLNPPKVETSASPSSSIAVLKAAVHSFHSRALSYESLMGILLGKPVKKRMVCASVIIGYNFEELVSDSRVKRVCASEGLQICGVAVLGEKEKGHQYIKSIVDGGSPSAICIGVPCLVFYFNSKPQISFFRRLPHEMNLTAFCLHCVKYMTTF